MNAVYCRRAAVFFLLLHAGRTAVRMMAETATKRILRDSVVFM